MGWTRHSWVGPSWVGKERAGGGVRKEEGGKELGRVG